MYRTSSWHFFWILDHFLPKRESLFVVIIVLPKIELSEMEYTYTDRQTDRCLYCWNYVPELPSHHMCFKKRCLHETCSLSSLRIATNLVRLSDTTDILIKDHLSYISFLYLQHVVSNQSDSGCKLSRLWIHVPTARAGLCVFHLGTPALPSVHMYCTLNTSPRSRLRTVDSHGLGQAFRLRCDQAITWLI
jgi:hypothetical protein